MRSPEVPDPLSQIQTNHFPVENRQEAAVLTKREIENHPIVHVPLLRDQKEEVMAVPDHPDLIPIEERTIVHPNHTREEVHLLRTGHPMEPNEAGTNLVKTGQREGMTTHPGHTREKTHLLQTGLPMELKKPGINLVKTDQKEGMTVVPVNSPTEETSLSDATMITEADQAAGLGRNPILPAKKQAGQ